MAFDWLSVAKIIGPKAVEATKKYLEKRDAAALKESRDEHATAAATEITRMILLGYTTASPTLTNLVLEYNELLRKGAAVPRDLRSTVESLVEKARQAQFSEYRADHRPGGHHYQSKVAAKKAPAKKAARKTAAKKAPAKKASAKRVAAKKTSARRLA